ncbi:DEAD/DEAH box helicase [Dictyocaulus viviparus]|uniref:DEAD/DEAH box helicase n=1 Tax=Dictyocaulus viviparus TaxID=29172 RepID=A0A0D8XUS9_DICVI|nr:DEAD/DEAH box helicase [Dictyocaulus viviparus]
MKSLCCVVQSIKRFSSSQRPVVKLNSDRFGSLFPTDIRVERLRWIKNSDFDTPTPSRTVKELQVPLSLPKKKRERVIKLLNSEPEPSTSHHCLIECSRQEFNLYENQLGKDTALCSQFWKKSKYCDDWFVIKRRTKIAKQFVEWGNSWECYVPDRLHPTVKNVLEELKLEKPTYVQSQCLKMFTSPHHLFIAAETGSGKTIAYAAPLVTRLCCQKQKGVSEKAIILAVTSSLKAQISDLLSKFVSNTNLTVATFYSKADVTDDWDILVGTPGQVEKYLRKSKQLHTVKHLVLDEADMLLDESFTDALTEIFSLIPIAYSVTNTVDMSSGARIIFSSAICPEQLQNIADAVVDRQYLTYVKSSKLHFLSESIEMKFIRVRETDKINRLKELLVHDMSRGELNETIVFCKNRATASYVHQQLRSLQYEVVLWRSPNDGYDKTSRIFVATDALARQIFNLASRLGRPLANIEADIAGKIRRLKKV